MTNNKDRPYILIKTLRQGKSLPEEEKLDSVSKLYSYLKNLQDDCKDFSCQINIESIDKKQEIDKNKLREERIALMRETDKIIENDAEKHSNGCT